MSAPMPVQHRTRRLAPAPQVPLPAPLVAVPPLPPPQVDHEQNIPDPSPDFVRALAVQGYEVLEGTRSVTQLGPLVSVGLARQLTVMRAVRNDRRIVYRDERRTTPRAAGVRIYRAGPDVAEASVVLRVGSRACATALRLEWAHRHWRAVELTVL